MKAKQIAAEERRRWIGCKKSLKIAADEDQVSGDKIVHHFRCFEPSTASTHESMPIQLTMSKRLTTKPRMPTRAWVTYASSEVLWQSIANLI